MSKPIILIAACDEKGGIGYKNALPWILPEDLLPKDQDNIWASGDDGKINYLESGHHIGINTVGQSLKNANRQIRSEPPNPRDAVSPWNISTIEHDSMRKQLELGEAVVDEIENSE